MLLMFQASFGLQNFFRPEFYVFFYKIELIHMNYCTDPAKFLWALNNQSIDS